MHVHFALHIDHNHPGVLGRVARELGSAVDWLSGPAMTEQERQERVMAEVRNQKHDSSAMSF